MRLALEKILKFMAKTILRRYRPKIVGITGSVGKTSTKEAVFNVLNSFFSVWKSHKNFNNEIGVPLSILGIKNNISWYNFPFIFFKWLVMLLWWPYPSVLILEMAVDRPNDMDYLLKFISIDVGILTNISLSHIKFFKNQKQLIKEKYKLINSVIKNQGCIIINIDDKLIRENFNKIKEKNLNINEKLKEEKNIFTYGFSSEAKVRATDIHLDTDTENYKINGISFKLNYQNKIIPLRLKNIIATHQIYFVLAGISAGLSFKLNLMDIIKNIEKFSPPKGRMKLKKGIKNIYILDDSYNASPISMLAGLETLQNLPSRRRVAILGDMLELGKISLQEHRKVIQKAMDLNIDLIVLVGKKMRKSFENLPSSIVVLEWKKRVLFFDDVEKLEDKIGEIIQSQDLVLIKGSHAIKLDKIVNLLAVDK